MFQKVGESTATTLSAPGYTVGATSINVGSTTNWPTTGVTFAIDEVDANGDRVSGTYNVFRGSVASGTQIDSLTYVGGDANRNYSAGATTRVYVHVTSYRENRLVDGLLVSHDQDGNISADNTATFSSNIDVNDSSTSVRDSSDNELLKFVKVASAVNEVTVSNNSTGNAPLLSATGSDTNIDLNLVSKGTGEVQVNGVDFSGEWQSWTPTLSGRFTDGDWTKTGSYKQIGKTVFFKLHLIATDSTPMAGGVAGATFTLPVTSISYNSTSTENIGTASILDSGTAEHLGVVVWISTTTATLQVLTASGTYVGKASISSTVPMTWTTNDEIYIQGFYEAP